MVCSLIFVRSDMEYTFQQTFTRATLREVAARDRIREAVHGRVNQTTSAVLAAAERGATSYFCELPPCRFQTSQGDDIPIEEYARAFQAKFPECMVAIVQDWVDVPAKRPTRTLTSGIRIHWA